MNIFQGSFNSFSNRCARLFCSYEYSTKPDKSSRTKIIKRLNYENKALFGPSIKIKSMTIKSKHNLESQNSSEMHWLLKSPSKAVQINTSKLCVMDGSNPKVETKTKESVNVKSISQDTKSLSPFTIQELRSMLIFPQILSDDKKFEVKADQSSRLPSVTKILGATLSDHSRKALLDWKLKKISELGEVGFIKLQEDHLRKGKLLHESIQTYFANGIQPTSESEIINLWKSAFSALETLKPKKELVEQRVVHPFLKYCGVVDCISEIGDELGVIEWKKADKSKTRIELTYDAPVQLCAYIGALSVDPKYHLAPKKGFVVVCYSDGQPAQIYTLDKYLLNKYWNEWLRRLQEFWIRTADGTLPDPI